MKHATDPDFAEHCVRLLQAAIEGMKNVVVDGNIGSHEMGAVASLMVKLLVDKAPDEVTKNQMARAILAQMIGALSS